MAKELTQAKDDFGMSESDMMTFMMIIVMALLMQSMVTSAAVTTTAQAMQLMQYEGRTDPREVDVPSDRIVWLDLIHGFPRVPWTWALFENDGPNDAEIGINDPSDKFILTPRATKTVDRLGAKERISLIFFYCRPTETAHVRIVGEY